MPKGALTGFLAGWNEQAAEEAELVHQADLHRMRAREDEAHTAQARSAAATEAVLARVFSGMPMQDLGDEDQMSRRLEVASRMLLPVNPKLGLDFANKASEMEQRKVSAKREKLAKAKDRREAQSGILASIDSQEVYEQGMVDYANAGGEIPQWYSGNFDRDKGRLRQLANSGVKAADQWRAATAQENAAIRLKDLIGDQKLGEARLGLQGARLGLAEERLKAQQDHWREELARKDREAAAKAAGKPVKRSSLPSGEDFKGTYQAMTAYPEFDGLDDMMKASIARLAAARAKKRWAEGVDESVADLQAAELVKIVNSKEFTPADPGAWWNPFSGSKPKFEPGAAPKMEAPKPEPAQTLPQVSSDADYAKLPSGTVFIGPDGVKRRKP